MTRPHVDSFRPTEHLSCLIYIHMWCADEFYEAILFVHVYNVFIEYLLAFMLFR